MYDELYKKTAEEIRQFMLNQDIGDSYIGDIPELIAQDQDSSSYKNAIEHLDQKNKTVSLVVMSVV